MLTYVATHLLNHAVGLASLAAAEAGREIFVARSTEEALEHFCLPDDELARVGRAARDRALAEHTAEARARRLVEVLTEAACQRAGE